MHLFFVFATSSLFSLGTHAGAGQRVLVGQEGEAICLLGDKVNLPASLARHGETKSEQRLDECTPRQIFSALAETPPEEIQAAGVGLMPFVLGAGAAPTGCLIGMESALEEERKKEYRDEDETSPESKFKQHLETTSTVTKWASIGVLIWLTGKEYIYGLSAPIVKGRNIFLPRNSYLAALAGLGIGAFGASFLCYILNSPHGGENSSSFSLRRTHRR